MANPTTFAMGKFGTVVPCATTTPLASELHMLGRLIGTDHPQGRAEARGIVERAEIDAAALVAALRAILPYAETRLEDMEENDDDRTEVLGRVDEDSRSALLKARDAFALALAAYAAATGESYHG